MLVEGLVAFVLADPRIQESSGLVAASTPGIVFTHNDSGDEARFFAVATRGATLTTYVLPDVQARDWEDIARGPDEHGRSSLWLGDIGDNDAKRDNGLLVHRVAEPVPGEAAEVVTEPPTSFRLRYEDGPGDAETLLVHPTHRTAVRWSASRWPVRPASTPHPRCSTPTARTRWCRVGRGADPPHRDGRRPEHRVRSPTGSSPRATSRRTAAGWRCAPTPTCTSGRSTATTSRRRWTASRS